MKHRKAPTNGRKLPKEVVNFAKALLQTGIPPALIRHINRSDKYESFVAALFAATFSRLSLTDWTVPSFEWFHPMLINWEIPGMKAGDQCRAKYITRGHKDDLMRDWMIQKQPDPLPSKATVIRSLFKRPKSFDDCFQEATQFAARESVFPQPKKGEQDHSFSLIHALHIINALFSDLGDWRLARTGLLSGDAIIDPLFMPVRLKKFSLPRDESPIGDVSGLLVVRPLIKERLPEKAEDVIDLEFISEPDAKRILVPVGGIVCLNNITWFRAES